jgi:nucleoside-diphosphate-sugar epimerase
MTQSVLVTGSSGFVGQSVVAALSGAGYHVIAASRSPLVAGAGYRVQVAHLPNLQERINWDGLLSNVGYVVHLAGIAHRGAGVSDETYDCVNHLAVADMATAAARAGVARLIFISSIFSQSGPSSDHLLSEADAPRPTTAYGRSKLAAEVALRGSKVAHTIFRPVLIYGPNARANIGRLVRLAASPWPLPFGALTGRRSLLAIDNLVSAIQFAIKSPATKNETYVIADSDAFTLPEIVAVLRGALGRSPRLIPVPQRALALALRMIGRGDLWSRIGDSLIVDPAKLIAAGWRPEIGTREGLSAMMRARVDRLLSFVNEANSSTP